MLYDLKIFQKVYDFLLWLKPTVQRFSRVHKYSLGLELEKQALNLLSQIIRANFKREDRKNAIEECFVYYEVVKILIRMAKDYKLLSLKQYEFAAKELEEIGKLLGGWYKRFS
jgi:hypothetical protein